MTRRDIEKSICTQAIPFEMEAAAYISVEAKDFITFCLNRKVDLRLSAEQLLNHPWLKKSGT